MSILDFILRARRMQQQNPQSYPVQLGIEQEISLWASDEERMEHFRQTTFTKSELEMAQAFDMGISGSDF